MLAAHEQTNSFPEPVATLGGFLNGVKAVNYAPDGRHLLIASNFKEAMRLYDPESWQDVLTLEGEGSGWHGALFSPDGNSIA